VKSRIEKDSLGEVKVPNDALYGAQTQRAIENFDYSYHPLPVSFIKALLRIKRSAAKANAELSEIPDATAKAIIDAVDSLVSAPDLMKHFPVNVYQTGSGTSTNMNANEVIANVAHDRSANIIIHPNDDVNFGQSSNDIIPTCLQLSLAEACVEDLLPAFDQVIGQLDELELVSHDVIKTGRTHLMDAMPISFAQEFATWKFQLSESRERIVSTLGRLTQVPLGGTAVGTGINRHHQYSAKVCELLSEEFKLPIIPCANLASRMSSQDVSLEMHGQLRVLATVLIKVSNDLRWMNSGPNSGLGEIQLRAIQPGSSIMPSKVNPVILESILMMCTKVLGHDTSVAIANQSGNFQLNVMLPLIADLSLSSVDLLTHSLKAMSKKVLSTLTINEKYLEQMVLRNPILITAINRKIGYDLAAKIAKTAQSQQRSILEVAEEMTDITRAELEKLLDPKVLAYPFEKS